MLERKKLSEVISDLLCRAPLTLRGEDNSPVLKARALTASGSFEFALASKDEKRLELLAMVRAGEPVELELDIEGFSQIDGVHNANHVRFKNSILGKLGKSFARKPFLKDHSQNKLDSRAGTILKSKAEPIEGGKRFAMSLEVTADWAVQAVLERNLDRFSIGWAHGGLDTILCSNCKACFLECWHFPGDVLTDEDSGESHVVEFIFTVAEGIEISGVNVPAVGGTGIEEIRSALSLAAGRGQHTTTENQTMTKLAIALAALLGLKSDADDETIVAAVATIKTVDETLSGSLEITQKEKSALSAEVVNLKAEVGKLEQKLSAGEIDDLVHTHANRFPVTRDDAGKLCTSPLEQSIRELASKDMDAARGILASMPAATTLATPIRKLQSDSIADELGEPPVSANAHVADQCKQLGITPEQYALYNPIDGTEVH